MENKIRICRTSTTMQHFTREGVPFTLSVHSAALLVGHRVVCVGFGETKGAAVQDGVRQFRARFHGARARRARAEASV